MKRIFAKENLKRSLKIFMHGLRQVVLAFLIFLLIIVFPAIGFGILRELNPDWAFSLAIFGPSSISEWIFFLINILWFPIALAIWVARDCIKFQNQGIKTIPAYLWAISVVLPTIIFALPLYLIFRAIVWPNRIRSSNAAMEGRAGFGHMAKETAITIIVIIFALYAVAMATDLPARLNQGKTDAAVAKIHATKLTMADVMGDNLPPDPGAEADKTVAGIDANQNGIRDDVELAIFKEYPKSAKTRAVLLQYALTLQMYMIQPIINSEIVVSVLEEESRASMCVAELVSRPGDNATNEDYTIFFAQIDKYDDFVKTRQIDNEMRVQAEKDFLKHIDSFGSSEGQDCDIDLSKLVN